MDGLSLTVGAQMACQRRLIPWNVMVSNFHCSSLQRPQFSDLLSSYKQTLVKSDEEFNSQHRTKARRLYDFQKAIVGGKYCKRQKNVSWMEQFKTTWLQMSFHMRLLDLLPRRIFQ